MSISDVLIVDDDEMARKLLARIVNSLNLPFREAIDGVDALAQVDQRVPGLILLDIMMPHMDGFEVIANLRSKAETRGIPVIVISAASTFEMPRLPGVSAIFTKANFNVDQVASTITSLMNISPPGL